MSQRAPDARITGGMVGILLKSVEKSKRRGATTLEQRLACHAPQKSAQLASRLRAKRAAGNGAQPGESLLASFIAARRRWTKTRENDGFTRPTAASRPAPNAPHRSER